MATIRPLETRYRGRRFRSRREARWAVFLDRLGVIWDYEPEGYLVDGRCYLPDFLIHAGTSREFWLEIKGGLPTLDEIHKAQALATGSDRSVFIYFGKYDPPGRGLSRISEDEFFDPADTGPAWVWLNDEGWVKVETHLNPPYSWEVGLKPTAYHFPPGQEAHRARSGHWWWTDCPYCGEILLKFQGQVGLCPTVCGDGAIYPDPPYPNFGHETPRLLAAYGAAAGARFEFGESG